MKKILRMMLFALFVASAGGLLSGCATYNPDNDNNISSIPWNTPKGWEGPMPSTMNQGR